MKYPPIPSYFHSPLMKHYGFWLISVFIVMGLSYLFISLTLTNHYLQQVQTRIHLHVADSIIEDHKLVNHGQLDKDAISSVFQRYILLNPHLEIYLLGLDGKILEYAADPKKIKRQRVNLTPILKHLNGQTESFLQGDDPRSYEQQKPFSAAFLPNTDSPESILYVIIQDSIEQEANRQLQESILLKLSGWSFLSSLIIGLILSTLIFYKLSNRISRLTNRVEYFKDNPNKSTEQNALKIRDELDQLDQAFIEMSDQIQQQFQQLKQADEQRRFMISGLSHDIRTPLTNMLGYMELLQQKSTSNYLNIAYQNGLKLKHYLDQLFEYSKLDIKGLKLKVRTLSISEFCSDIVVQYRNTYPKNSFQIQIEKNIMQQFDPNQMERAIRNLLDNALKHGQGEIIVQLQQKDQETLIAVCDHGETMDNPIYTRKAENPSGGLGLGLVIVESIIQKHCGKLTFSRCDQLNCFTLSLPVIEATTAKSEEAA